MTQLDTALQNAHIPGYMSLQQVDSLQNWAFLAGMIAALAMVYFWRNWRWVFPAIWNRLKATPPETRRTVAALMLMVFVFAAATATQAQTATPVPPTATSTPGLTIPVNTVMSSSNDWIERFAPIAAIGIGISIALAILGYLGKMIKSAFD